MTAKEIVALLSEWDDKSRLIISSGHNDWNVLSFYEDHGRVYIDIEVKGLVQCVQPPRIPKPRKRGVRCPYCGAYNAGAYKGTCPQCPPGQGLRPLRDVRKPRRPRANVGLARNKPVRASQVASVAGQRQ